MRTRETTTLTNTATFSLLPHYWYRPTTCSWATMWTAESSRSKWCAFSLRTKLSIPRTFSSCVGTTSALESIGFTDSTMSAVAAFRSKCGSNFATRSTVCLAVPSLTTKLFACTEGFHRNSRRWNKLPTLLVLVTCRIPDSCAIFSGPIRIQALRYVILAFSWSCLFSSNMHTLAWSSHFAVFFLFHRAGARMIVACPLPLAEMLCGSSSVGMI